MTEPKRINLLNHIRPVHLLTATGLYLLGTGLARYLGERINSLDFLLGLAWVIFLQQGFHFLGDHFQTPFDPGLYGRMPFDSPRMETQQNRADDVLLLISLALFSAAAFLSIILGIQKSVSLASGMLMGFSFLGYLLLTVPGLSLDNSGIGEIIASITLVLFPPALGFLIQFGSFHPFLAYAVFPLFPIHIAFIILLQLVSYRNDLKQSRKNLLVRIGWVRAIFLHNMMVLSGFLLFGIGLVFGFPIRLAGFVFFVLPAALYLVWYLSKLEDGAPVRWPLLSLLSLTVFFLPLYLLTFSSWVN